ncbi:MAG: class I SAM-dependent methyltransferase [Chloroflexi bacterium]|nr:class I SAM-dependent methyltransferase [Chloroflexota bacterium]MCY3582324.1 class I SAM-dependent methyltransferase [Chloroflexota bacterium]MCY3715941.1 class I SAM-dependent methyltransferase [Chloroflexota bacterium]MDE2649724.1 class I SAM-dependent methyltransferase [Chloroflexota bacterium]
MRRAPILRDGIDLIYIDSLHSARHVADLIMLWYPKVRQGGWLAFDDVDPGPYLRGQRKDNANQELAWRAIRQVIMDFFYANKDDLLLEIHYRSTGLAMMRKLAQMSKAPQPPRHIRRRRLTPRSVAKRLVGRA